MKFLCSLLSVVFTLCLITSAQSEPVFVEDWSSQAFSADWQVLTAAGGDGEVAIEESPTGSGDYAAYTKGPTNYNGDDWDYSYFSTATYDRAENLRCTFQTWRDPTKPTWAGPVNFGINGPWHHNINATDAYGNLNCGVGGWDTLPQTFQMEGWNTGTALPQAIADAFNASTDRASGIWFKVWLGNTSGGKLEWSTDGETFELVEDRTDDPAAFSNNGLYLGFATHAGAVFIDNIMVEDDSHIVPVELSAFILE